MNDKEIYFHVGLGKTGTTFLQYRVFPKLRSVYYIQRTRYKQAKKILRHASHEKILLSREFDQQMEREVSSFAADYPETTPIIVLRRQDSYIASQYRRYVKNGYRGTFAEFFDLENDQGRFKKAHLRYSDTLSMLKKYFSKQPIVLIYDQLREKPRAFVRKLAEELSVVIDLEQVDFSKKHASYDEKQLKAMQYAGRFINLRKRQVTNNKVLHFFWRLGLGAVRYSVLYVGQVLPTRWYSDDPLIDPEELVKVREAYAQDWEKCLEVGGYTKKNGDT